MNRLAAVAALLPLALSLAGCAGAPLPEPPTTGLIVGAGEVVHGWPSEVMPILDLPVSTTAAEACPVPWTLLAGDEIERVIPSAEWASLEVTVCAFGATPGSADPDVLDEMAFRVDEGAAALIEIYARHAASAPTDPPCAPSVPPLLAVEFAGERYGIWPAGEWCLEGQPDNRAALDALVLTTLGVETVSFQEGLD